MLERSDGFESERLLALGSTLEEGEKSKMPHCNKKMISFFLTTKCNLCCRYCYNAKETHYLIF